MDCIGLLVLSSRAVGAEFEDEKGYGREPWNDRLSEGFRRRFGAALPPSSMRVGDIAEIRWGIAEPSHAGVVGAHPDCGLSLIHVHTLRGCVEQLISGSIAKAIVAVYRPWSDL